MTVEKDNAAGSAAEPVRYVGNEKVRHEFHDGALRPVVGVQSYQAFRANREVSAEADGLGWTYVNQQYMTYWNNRFFIQYITNQVGEHEQNGQAMLLSSLDGCEWTKPEVVFPVYTLADGSGAVMHHRMGFFISSSNRLLTVGFYGVFPTPNDGKGIGRVVREIHRDGSFGPVYFIRYNSHMGWNEGNTNYPVFTVSEDAGFVEACRELLADKLVTLQWWEEDQGKDGFYAVEGGKALSYYQRKDGKTVALWKGALAALSDDQGQTWSVPVPSPSIIVNGAKEWGQRMSDGTYAVVYNPTPDNLNRWPLAVITGEDGSLFDRMLCVEGEVPPIRYQGSCKTPGLQYVRGIEQLEKLADKLPDTDMWLSQAMNKEDVWVHRVPVPIRDKVEESVHDTFDDMEIRGTVKDWNIYSGQWTPVRVVNFPGTRNKCLQLKDKDPYDYARAFRVFKESTQAHITFKLYTGQNRWGWLDIEIMDPFGARPVRVTLDNRTLVVISDGNRKTVAGNYLEHKWYTFEITVDVPGKRFNLSVDGKNLWVGAAFAEEVSSVERVCFRTGVYRTKQETPTVWVQHYADCDENRQLIREDITNHVPDLPNAGIPEKEAVYYVDDVLIESLGE